ncbi:serine hydrolase [Jannaschia marina]|uniref:serine hydrolase n=1 Tax=Jannaschia marina TaxID=2741674 RepID=UPI0015C848ED|nr:serine hydrolase [Jannaschia marina]
MTVFDPSALGASQRAALDAYFDDTPAPAVLVESWRYGLSVAQAKGLTGVDTGEAARVSNTFEIGSQTKIMTSVIVLQLAAEGLIDLDARASDYYDMPEVANAEVVTVRELLSHRSGIADFDSVPGQSGLPAMFEELLADPTKPIGPDRLLTFVEDVPPLSEPGTAYAYSNTNYLLLQRLVEAVTGESLSDLFQDRIFDGAGMEDSKLDPSDRSDDRLRSYVDLGDGPALDVTDMPIDLGGAGGVVSTTSDMIRFFDALLVSKTLLPPEILEQMLDFRAEDGNPDMAGEGLGISSGVVFGKQLIGFQGGTLGTRSATFLDVETGTIVSVAASHFDADPADLMLQAFAALFNDEEWGRFDPDSDVFEMAVPAADLNLSEATSVDGSPRTKVTAADVSLTLDGAISALDTGRFEFTDGSTLRIGTDGYDRIDVLRQTPDAAHADNQLIGLGGHDNLSGGHGEDRLLGGAGHDRLRGRGGDDWLEGGEGRDHLRGGSGDDVLDGGRGADFLQGGRGADRFVFELGDGRDRLLRFEPGTDVIDLSATGLSFEDLRIEQGAWGRQEIVYGDGDSILLFGTTGCLQEEDFLFG